MDDERERRNGHGCTLNCSMELTTEGADNDEGGLLLNGSSGGVSFGEGTSAEKSKIIYKRRKRRKMSSSEEKTTTEFNDKIKAGDDSASNHDVPRLSFDASLNVPDKWSVRHCRKMVLQQMHQSHSRHENGVIRNAVTPYSESGCTPADKESVERSENQTQNSVKEHPPVMSSRLLNQSEGPTKSKLCELAFSDILMSDKFSELCGLLLKNFGVVNVNQILDLDAINTKIKNGTYETSPLLYHNDIRQVWTKLQEVGNEIVTVANSLCDKSRAHYEQESLACGGSSKCHGCGGATHPQNCLVCDSCEEIYHVSCTDLLGPEMPPKTWFCPPCLSKPHDTCAVCLKLKSTTTTSTSIPPPPPPTATPPPPQPSPRTCFICKEQVKGGDEFRTCGHSLCPHKFYHCRCLTNKQMGVCGPCWYCPSCLCRRCMVDKDDHQIVLCDGCDQAYHIYCTTPQLDCIPDGKWFCSKCYRELRRINTMKSLYENMHNNNSNINSSNKKQKVKLEDDAGLDMLVTAAKTLSHQDTIFS